MKVRGNRRAAAAGGGGGNFLAPTEPPHHSVDSNLPVQQPSAVLEAQLARPFSSSAPFCLRKTRPVFTSWRSAHEPATTRGAAAAAAAAARATSGRARSGQRRRPIVRPHLCAKPAVSVSVGLVNIRQVAAFRHIELSDAVLFFCFVLCIDHVLMCSSVR